MKVVGVFVLTCIAALSTTAKADGKCETIQRTQIPSFGTLQTCNMDSTAIDSKDFSITSDRDESVEGFWPWNNRQLKYLPNNIGEKFPSLLVLWAGWCLIKEVSKDTLKGLGKLQHLCLQGNQIEKIDDDTFEYIPAVEYIDLHENKIKKINGRAFASLHKLTTVLLQDNECISDDFKTEARIAELPRVVTEKCGLTESESSTTKIVETETDLMAQSESSAAKILSGGGTWLICFGS